MLASDNYCQVTKDITLLVTESTCTSRKSENGLETSLALSSFATQRLQGNFAWRKHLQLVVDKREGGKHMPDSLLKSWELRR